MDAPMISIKLKGLQAIQALNANGGQFMGPMMGMNLNGGGILVRLKDMDNGRMMLKMKNGMMMMRDMDMEGKRMLLLQPASPPPPPPVPLAAKAATKIAIAPAAPAMEAMAAAKTSSVAAAKTAMSAAGAGKTALAVASAPAAIATTKSAALSVAKSAAVPAAAALSGLGWGLALGALWPWIALGSAGLAATGIYFYVQARRMVTEVPEWDAHVPPGSSHG
jgi:hypothetical protein